MSLNKIKKFAEIEKKDFLWVKTVPLKMLRI